MTVDCTGKRKQTKSFTYCTHFGVKEVTSNSSDTGPRWVYNCGKNDFPMDICEAGWRKIRAFNFTPEYWLMPRLFILLLLFLLLLEPSTIYHFNLMHREWDELRCNYFCRFFSLCALNLINFCHSRQSVPLQNFRMDRERHGQLLNWFRLLLLILTLCQKKFELAFCRHMQIPRRLQGWGKKNKTVIKLSTRGQIGTFAVWQWRMALQCLTSCAGSVLPFLQFLID